MTYNFSGAQQSDSVIHIYILFFRLFSIVDYYKILTTVPCAIHKPSLLHTYCFFLILLLLLLLFFTLQYYIGFAIHQHASATGVHVFPSWTPLPSHPSGSSQCTSSKLPVSCIEPGLAIRFLYDTIHVLMPFSQIIPLFPLPQSPKDCSIHLCLFFCLAYMVVITIFLNSIYMR